MVEPEVDHDFFELTLAVGGAQDLGLHQLGQCLPLHADRLGLLRRHHLSGARRRSAARRHRRIASQQEPGQPAGAAARVWPSAPADSTAAPSPACSWQASRMPRAWPSSRCRRRARAGAADRCRPTVPSCARARHRRARRQIQACSTRGRSCGRRASGIAACCSARPPSPAAVTTTATTAKTYAERVTTRMSDLSCFSVRSRSFQSPIAGD